MRYVYSVVRFVPDPARGEFVNVGAIVGSEEASEWQLRQVENPVRARAIDARKSLGAVWSFLDRIGREIDDFEREQATLFDARVELSETWLERLYTQHRNVVQLTAPTPMVASSADEALERIFEQMVVDPALRKHAFRKKHVALAAVRASYRHNFIQPGANLRERVALHTAHHSERLDFAVTNGRALQLAHTWSFEVPDQDQLAEQVKAWGWSMMDLKRGGGTVTFGDHGTLDVRRDVDVQVVYVPPRDDADAPAMRAAVDVFDNLGIRHGPLEMAESVGARARELLVAEGDILDIRPADG